jgi:uncharacterized protein (DUF4415 family)
MEIADPDNPEWTEAEAKRAVSFAGLPSSLQAKLRDAANAPASDDRIAVPLSPVVVEAFRATGMGWQYRMDAVLKSWLEEHIMR